MNIRLQNPNRMTAGCGISSGGMMKSTLQKLERQAARDSQVAFFEDKKKNLKNIECSSPEEAARVLELLHSYEDQIAAVRAEYNNAQMFHLMDEARERGEEIAKAVEKSAPKTAEERKKEAVEEALGTEEEKGLLSDILDEAAEEIAEALEDMSEAEASLDQEAALAAEVAAGPALDQEPALATEASATEPAPDPALAVQASATEPAPDPALAMETSAAEPAPNPEPAFAAQAVAEPLYDRPQEVLPAHPVIYKSFDAFA